MIRSEEEILVDIDTTLDQLLENAATMNRISFDSFFATEIEALKNTQESLLARLIHMNELLDQEDKRSCFRKQPKVFSSIENKINQFADLDTEIVNQVKQDLSAAKQPNKNRPKIRKNRKRIKVPC